MIEGYLAWQVPHLPQRDSLLVSISPLATSAAIHVMGLVAVVVVMLAASAPPAASMRETHDRQQVTSARIVFLSGHGVSTGGGGGGGGNRHAAPIPRAERAGRDQLTLPVAPPLNTIGRLIDVPVPAQRIVLDAKPLAAGAVDQIGALEGAVGLAISQGSGSGGGVGDGAGTGIGSGRGPGLGPGEGGGTGGGVYRPGGAVAAPTIRLQVRPMYTSEALHNRIQGSVVLEVIVRRDGMPSDIRVVRSLDRHGLDEQAIVAVQQWRFNPGRLAGTPVDVLVTVVLDFSIR